MNMIVKMVTGVMGAGKSEQLIEDVRFYVEKKMNVAVVKVSPGKHKRRGAVTSRNGKSVLCLNLSTEQTEAEVLASLSFYIKEMGNADYIFIDEAQFLNAEQINAVETVARLFDCHITFYGLMNDFRGKIFDGSDRITTICDDVFVIPAECEIDGCERDAVHNGRFVDGQIVIEGKRIVEDKECYKALCPMCFNVEKRKILESK